MAARGAGRPGVVKPGVARSGPVRLVPVGPSAFLAEVAD
ncbi:hypothetical protein, partial [Nocardioides plantarum]